jgi:hypothetical protein
MWNSNSVTSWLMASGGLCPESIQPPAGGRAPGWKAGAVVARRQQAQRHSAYPVQGASLPDGAGSTTVREACGAAADVTLMAVGPSRPFSAGP